MNYRTTIHIANKDRHSEIALMLQSLRTQTYQDWDVIILDDSSGSPLNTCGFFVKLINRLKLEGHKVKFYRNDMSYGVCAARNSLIEKDKFNNKFTARIDDDVLLEPDYLEKLHKVLEQGYDIATGIVPNIEHPEIKREIKYVEPVISRIDINDKSEITHTGDDLGFSYIEEKILPTHHFRTNALYYSNIDIKYKTNLTKVGFREESFFSLQAIMNGLKIGVHTGAVAYHFRTPSGGVRCTDYNECVQTDDKTFKEWVKKNGNSIQDKMHQMQKTKNE